MSRDLVERRRASVPPIRYPEELPITARRDELLRTIRDNQVVVVAGETGSGKSTQIPKLCLELGRGVEGLIGHTQPRRIAARSIAERVASEIGTTVGGLVGYTVRFTDEVSDQTLVKLMTDGILLAEMQRDRELRRYDTIIIDEAHERSLNIDFLLGYLRRLVDRRPDLKVIITSATIDTARFAAHFSDAPIVEVAGRTHPVEVRYHPLGDPDDPDAPVLDQTEGIGRAVKELLREQPHDVLVFLSGEREIRDAADHLGDLRLPDLEVLPLYARLSPAEQQRVFAPHRGRRVVLATNVAETSLTVPGVHSVVDTGTARISRFNRRTKVQRLPIEAVSQASADQRAGRCGRLGPGVCIRLYAEDDFLNRPEFTEPEIQRTNLASVILQMASLGLGDVESFPFVDPPDHRAIRDGIRLLEELDAVDPAMEGTRRWLTPLGRQLAAIPVDPRLGRMLLEADDHGCVAELLVIVSGLSIQDPRIRPTGVGSGAAQQRAVECHARYTHEESDFLSYLQLWKHIRDERSARSGNGFRRMCRDEYLHYLRIREWQDVHGQLRRVAADLGLRPNDNPADPDSVHQALLAGLLSHVGFLDSERRDYRGARNARFVVAPGSAMKKRTPKWVMAGELVETNQLRGRVVAPVNPQWLERSASHLLAWTYSDPWWDTQRGSAMCDERASLYGLPVVPNRAVNVHRVEPGLARDLFIRHALVEGDWDTHHRFAVHNAERMAEVAQLQHRLRRDDLLITDEALAELYSSRLPDEIVSVRHFDRWWRQQQGHDPSQLDFRVEDLIDPALGSISADDFPESWSYGDLDLALHYEHDAASLTDGVSIDIPLNAVSRVDSRRFDWLVPGLRRELVTELLRTLPKPIRRLLVPIPATVDALLPGLEPGGDNPLLDQLRDEVVRLSGEAVLRTDFRPEDLDTHLRPHFRIVDRGESIAEDDDLDLLKRHLHEQARELLKETSHELETTGLTTWTIDELPRVIESSGLGQVVRSFPSLVDEGQAVAVRLLATEAEQHEAMWLGTRRLLLLNRPAVGSMLRSLLDDKVKFAIIASPYGSPGAWFEDCLTAATDELLHRFGGPVWNTDSFNRLLGSFREALPESVLEVANSAIDVLVSARRLSRLLNDTSAQPLQEAVADMGAQLDRLVHPGFIAGVGAHRLADVDRYLRAALWRGERLASSVARDRDRMTNVRPLEAFHDRLADVHGWTPRLEELSWQLQELRVSLFAQPVGAKGTVSVKRLREAIEDTERALG